MSVDDSMREQWSALSAERSRQRGEPELPLQGGGGGGTLPPMDGFDAKLSAVEARTDAKFAQVRGDISKEIGELKTILASKPGTGALIGIAVALFAAILAALAFAGDRLALGVGLADARMEQMQRDRAQDEKFDQILARLPDPQQSATPKP